MEIPFDKQARTDFDWFGVDEDDLIDHFTTAGFKRLPPSVAKSAEDLRTVTDYFGNVGLVRGSHTVDHQHGYLLLTHDLDFGAILAATHGQKPSVIPWS